MRKNLPLVSRTLLLSTLGFLGACSGPSDRRSNDGDVAGVGAGGSVATGGSLATGGSGADRGPVVP